MSHFQYLGSTISSNQLLEPEINTRIAKAAGVMSKLEKRVWSNNNLTDNTKMQVYRVCLLSTLLYSSKAWPTYAAQESFHLRCLWHVLSIRWQERIPNTEVLQWARLPSILTLLTLAWLGHMHLMDDGRIPKDLLYGESTNGVRARGPSTPPLQRHMQAGHERCEHQHQHMGKPRGRPQSLEVCCPNRC